MAPYDTEHAKSPVALGPSEADRTAASVVNNWSLRWEGKHRSSDL